jgi:TonB family protein
MERRLCVRRAIPSLAYVDLGENNGGIILNIGEGGLAVTSVAPLFTDALARMRFQLPGSSDWLEASGEVTRISDSKKEAGLQFVSLSEDTRKLIKGWVSSGETPDQWHQQTVNVSVEKEVEEEQRSMPVAEIAQSSTDSLTEAAYLLQDPNRRLHVRRAVPSLAYVNLGENNGGIILNIGEGGLAVTSVAPLFTDALARMRFQLPGSSDWLEASGEITRISDSKKEAGLQFVGLSEDTRKQIQDWISSTTSSAELQPDGVGGRKKAWRRLEMPVLGIPQSITPSLANPDWTRRKYAQVSQSAPDAPSTLVNTKAWAAASASTVLGRKLSGRTDDRPGAEAGNRSKPIFSGWRSWTTVTVVVLLVAFLAGWFTSGSGTTSGIFARPGATRTVKSETAEVAGSPPANFVASISGPSTPNALSRVDEAQPVASTTAGDFASQVSRETRSAVRSSALAPASSGANRPSARVVHSPGPVNAFSRPAENARQPEPASVATQTQATTVATPPSPNVSTPEGVRTAGAAGQDSPVPLKPAENPEAAKASVSVSFGLYPSIRVPTGLKSQMSQQGASLQIGQLLSRVDPVYPEDAKTQGTEGTVKLHAIIGPDGTIASVESRGGPALLIPAATDAVRQWRYTPSSVGSKPVEAEEDITITFRLSK